MRRTTLLSSAALLFFPAVAQAQSADDACIEASDKSGALRKESKLLEARAQLALCSATSCPEIVRTSCEQRLEQMNALIPTIVFDVKNGAGEDIADVKLTIDGVLRAEKLGGAAIALDPVDHEFTFEVPGQPPLVKHFVLHERDARRELITIGAPPPVAKAQDAPPLPPPPPPERRSKWTTTRIAGWSAIGASGIAIGIGSAFGLTALSKKNEAGDPANCPTKTLCTAHGAGLIDDAKSAAAASTIAFVVGGVALAGGITLLVLTPASPDAPQAPPASARLSLGSSGAPLGLSVGGAW